MDDGTKAMHLRKALTDSRREHPLLAIGAVNALAAHVAAEAGFDALWVSGLEVSAASGLPDANVLGPRDLSDVVASLGRVTDLPVIVDIAWLEQDHQHKIPQKSLLPGWTTQLTMNPQVKDMISVAGNVNVKYKETARGGLAVNTIEC
ncbi:isocitrate lyase/phosphoenolpyruvate mutase family protein [Streptomyces albidoflavus]